MLYLHLNIRGRSSLITKVSNPVMVEYQVLYIVRVNTLNMPSRLIAF